MKSYTKSKKIHPCRFNRDDLFKLVEIIESDFPKTERKKDFEISTSFNDLNIDENSIEDFFKHQLPDVLTRLSFSKIGWSANHNNINKRLSLRFYDNFISLDVSGDSETWVSGKFIQIVDFLKTKRPFFWFFSTLTFNFIQGALMGIIFVSLIFFVIESFKNGFGSVGIWAPSAVIFLILFCLAVENFRYVRIYLKNEKPFIEKYKSVFIIITAIGSIVTIVGFILQYLSKIIKAIFPS